MKEGQIVFRLFLPTYQDAPKAVHPAVGSLIDPAPCTIARHPQRLPFLAPAQDMVVEALRRYRPSYAGRVVPLVGTEVPFLLLRWVGNRQGQAVNQCVHFRGVVHVRTRDRQADGHALPFGHEVALRPSFAPVGRVWANVPAAKRGLGGTTVHGQPFKVQEALPTGLEQAGLPQLPENARLGPFLEAVVDSGGRTKALGQGLPLDAGAEDIEHCNEHLPSRLPGPAALGRFALGGFVREQWLCRQNQGFWRQKFKINQTFVVVVPHRDEILSCG